jgi:DNA repair exonuclease SbcCD ATPase subunit
MENIYDIYTPEPGHFERFQSKLNKRKKKVNLYTYYLPIAASILLAIGLGWVYQTPSDLAQISPELKQTQAFFEGNIQQEMTFLETMKDSDHSKIISDGMLQIEQMEAEYQKLRKELDKVGYNKKIIHAMIMNYQYRMEVLQNIIKQIENTQQLTPAYHEQNSI